MIEIDARDCKLDIEIDRSVSWIPNWTMNSEINTDNLLLILRQMLL